MIHTYIDAYTHTDLRKEPQLPQGCIITVHQSHSQVEKEFVVTGLLRVATIWMRAYVSMLRSTHIYR